MHLQTHPRLHLRLALHSDLAEATRVVESVLKVKAITPEPNLLSAPMADPERVTDLLIALRGVGIHLDAVSMQEPTLDEVFMTLTGNPRPAEEGVS